MGKRNRNPPPPVDSPSFLTQTPFRIVERAFKRKATPLPAQIAASIVDPRSYLPGHDDHRDHAGKDPNHHNNNNNNNNNNDNDNDTTRNDGDRPRHGVAVVDIPHPALHCAAFRTPRTTPGAPSPPPPPPPPAVLRALTFSAYPGLIVIPSPFDPTAERAVIRACLDDWTRRPNVTNLDTHYVIDGGDPGLWGIHARERAARAARAAVGGAGGTPDEVVLQRREMGSEFDDGGDAYGGDEDRDGAGAAGDKPSEPANPSTAAAAHRTLFVDPPTSPTPLLAPLTVSEAIKRWRWTSVGLQYNWSTKEYHMDRPVPVPPLLRDLSCAVVRAVERVTGYSADRYRPEAGIINFYQLQDSLTAHQDRSEVDDVAPLVSFSFGHACIFLMGLQTREEAAPTPIILRSGDIVVMSGPCRRNFHGVPRILADTLPAYLRARSPLGDDTKNDDDYGAPDAEWEIYGEYLETSRINVNVRQVFPFLTSSP